jgi:hypothetical protein
VGKVDSFSRQRASFGDLIESFFVTRIGRTGETTRCETPRLVLPSEIENWSLTSFWHQRAQQPAVSCLRGRGRRALGFFRQAREPSPKPALRQ